MAESGPNPDVVTELVGDMGRWQVTSAFLVIPFAFIWTYHGSATNYIASPTEFSCESIENASCSCPMEDRRWSRDTIIAEWSLVCDRAWLAPLPDLALLAGVAVSGVLTGQLADRYGRRRALFVSAALQVAIGVAMALSPSIELFIALKFTIGITIVSVAFAGLVLLTELTDGRWTLVLAVCNYLALPVAYVVMPLVSLVLPAWRTYQTVMTLFPQVIIFILWFVKTFSINYYYLLIETPTFKELPRYKLNIGFRKYVPESPRWQISTGRVEEALRTLERAARLNGRALPDDSAARISLQVADAHTESSASQGESPRLRTLFSAQFASRTINLSVAWFSSSIVYYGLVLKVGNLGGDLLLTPVLLGVVEVPAILVALPLVRYASQRYTVAGSLLVSGAALAGAAVVGSGPFFTAFLLVGKFCAGCFNVILPFYTAELYPIRIRNLGMGFTQFGAAVSLMLIPYLWAYGEEWVPLAVVAALGVLGAGAVLLLPNTSASTGTTSTNGNEKELYHENKAFEEDKTTS